MSLIVGQKVVVEDAGRCEEATVVSVGFRWITLSNGVRCELHREYNRRWYPTESRRRVYASESAAEVERTLREAERFRNAVRDGEFSPNDIREAAWILGIGLGSEE